MSFTASDLHLNPVAPGRVCYLYQTTDTMATVLGASYFDFGPNAAPRFVAGDLIYVVASDGAMWLRISETSDTTGVCTAQYRGGSGLPIRTFATGTALALAKLSVGHYEVGTSIATATRAVLPTPYPGAEVRVVKVDSGSQLITFDAGASASDVSLGASAGAAGGGTGVTFDAVGNRRITFNAEGEWFHVVGTSTSRWRLVGFGMEASAAGLGGSRFFAGT